MRFKNTYGASGTGAIASGRPTRSGCSAPGISLSVHTTSGPKYGQSPVAYQRRPIKKICVGSSKKNFRVSPYRRRKTKNAARATTAIATRRSVLAVGGPPSPFRISKNPPSSLLLLRVIDERLVLTVVLRERLIGDGDDVRARVLTLQVVGILRGVGTRQFRRLGIERETFDHVQLVTVSHRRVQYTGFESDRIHDQHVAVPAADRVTSPGRLEVLRVRLHVHVNSAPKVHLPVLD